MKLATSTAPTSTCRRTPSRRSAPTAWPSGPHHRGRWHPFAECGPAPDSIRIPRPCRYYEGTGPHKRPQDLDDRLPENTEDIYMGVEWEADDPVGQSCASTSTRSILANAKLGKRQIPRVQESASSQLACRQPAPHPQGDPARPAS